MPAERVSMSLREILRLKHAGRANGQIARSLSLARSTVGLELERAAAAGAALAVAGDADRSRVAGDAVCRPRQPARHAAQAEPGLGLCPSRAAPARRHADAAVEEQPRSAPDGHRYGAGDRTAPGKPAVANDAPGPSAGERLFVDFVARPSI